ncbi:DUF4349 domain-containing protein [Ruicaihuangia caeni]|uniref:DUF4349 domain-containing protein n=1 Tax=Ruicaihuangia caeni TaxID=3042517 RepID=A0AAW6T8Z1_9MICO|nr:DUF4349 domain-containing protein [Klugiella sp. YN-L-19]MDI2099586.1 DUF4349 domain-containing protein [Klugiella sp. YN-L-19]
MRRTAAAAALLFAALTLTACTAPSGTVAPTDMEAPVPSAPDFPGEDGGGEAGSDSDLPAQPAPDAADREIITTGTMTVVVEDPERAASYATDIVTDAGGRVDARTERAAVPGSPASATLSLRVPASKLDSVLDDLKSLGEARDVSLSSEDVTLVTRDLDARITALEASVDRLLAMLEGTTDTKTLIEVETALSQRQSELESMQAQRRYYSDQVSLSTIRLSLIAPSESDPTRPDDFWSGLVTGWNALVAFFSAVLVALGVALPWLLLLALIALIVLLIVRSALRRNGRAGARSPVAPEAAAQVPAVQAPAEQAPPAGSEPESRAGD